MIRRSLRIAAVAVLLGAAGGIGQAAQQPALTTAAASGLWELSGLPGGRAPARQCIASIAELAQHEHLGRGCAAARTLSDNGKAAVFYYTCPGSDFGRTSIKLVTPRNLKVETQGISDGLPFAYAFQARRVGECKGAGGGQAERGR